MNPKKISVFIVLVCIVSLLFILFYSYFYNPVCVNLTTHSNFKEKDVVCYTGYVRNISIYDNLIIFDLINGSSKIKNVLFNYNTNDLNLLNNFYLNNNKISVLGKIQFYNNDAEIIVYKFRNI